MKKSYGVVAICLSVVLGLAVAARSQSSLTDKLAEQDNFYLNYGKEEYSKLKIEKDVIGLYDYFGEHITDGVQLYDLRNESSILSSERERNSKGELITDSVKQSTSSEFQSKDFFEKFSNLVVTQDAIGGTKTSFLVGDQITTKFTPLTFNKTNFKGIRWDVWSTGLQFSVLLSRTRPGFLSTKASNGFTGTGTSLVEYPRSPASFDTSYYNAGGSGGIRGAMDFSSKSPYGDYDFLMALHLQNNIANKVDVGLTLINHHVSDVAKGEKFIKGELPNGWMPSEIHFEFYDKTPLNENDAGVYVYDVRMKVNGKLVENKMANTPYRTVYVGSQDSILRPRDLPMPRPQSGIFPVIVAFKTDPKYWTGPSIRDSSQIKTIEFEYKVAGNYLVYVSTSRQIPLCISGIKDLQTGEVTYSNPEKRVETIFNPSEGGAGSNQPLFIGNAGSTGNDESQFSTTYYGEYIRMSPKIITLTSNDFAGVCANPENWGKPAKARELYNFGTYQYTYGINISSVTYGVDFRGELGGVKFSGEVALNQREEKFPTYNGERDNNFRMVGTFKGERELGKNTGLSGDLYYISPDWQTNLLTLQPSKYFKETKYKSYGSYPDYEVYPRPLGNSWQNIDDNDDNDPFVESDRRRYPSDYSSDAQGSFYDDGTAQGWIGVRLPSDMLIPYDDPDGVISSKDDRNRNGWRDYSEDFLAFTSDPPVFELGMDLNNNGIPDYEDDDILPDFGHSVGNVITSDGIKTQGIRGLNLNLRWTPKENLVLDFGAVVEGIADHDLTGVDDLFEDKNNEGSDPFAGKALVGYWTTKLDVTKRSQGIMLKLGNELRAISDAIRNDAISSVGSTAGGKYYVGYWYTIDPLNYRRTLMDNIVADIVYNNIRNFEYGFKAKLGIQKRFAIADRLFDKEYSFYDPVKSRTIFAEDLTPYDDRTIGDLYLVNRVSYRIGFKNEYEDWRRVFNFLNRLEIIPQYKVTLIGSREFGSGLKDPRDIESNLRADIDQDGVIDTVEDNVGANLDSVTARRIAANEYRDRNKVFVQNLPILRVNYKIAENTQFQFGLQTKRTMDAITPENNSFDVTTLGQVVSKYNYKGYNVTFLIGLQWQNYNFDINAYDPVLLSGGRWDQDNWKFYAQLFSGS